MNNLYELNETMKFIDNYLEKYELEEEQKEEAENFKVELLDKISNNAEEIYKYIKEVEARVQAKKEEEKRLFERRKIEENKIDRLKELIQGCMNTLKKDKIDTNLGYFKIRKNPLKVNVLDETKIPEKYIQEEIIKKKVKKICYKTLKKLERR